MLLIKKNVYDQLKSFITRQYGLYFKDCNLKNLKKLINKRLIACKLGSAEEYYKYLTTSEHKEYELRKLLNLLTIQHTYFFRNEPHFKALKEKILPDVISKKTTKTETCPIRIWSAGCSTGQEPYTIAMIASDVIGGIDKYSMQIIATDISSEALEIAQNGIYDEKAIKSISKAHRQNYFTKISVDGKLKYQIKDSIKRLVKFEHINLIDTNYPENLDVIFCRNVMIYFGKDDVKKITDRFESSLNDPGYLFIGCSESLKFITNKLKMAEYDDAIFYKKNNEDVFVDKVPAINFSSYKADVKHEAKEDSCETEELITENINETIQLKEYKKAAFFVEQLKKIVPNTAAPYCFSAQILANQGEFEKAKDQLMIAQELNEFFVPTYYMLGSIYTEQQDYELAKINFKKAIFLDNNFVLSHFTLAIVCKNTGDIRGAINEYENTIKILSRFKLNKTIQYSGGFNAGTLKSICKNNLELLRQDL